MIRGAPATGPPLFLSPEKEGEANMHDHFMSPETDAAKPHDHFISPCRAQQNTPHKRPGTGRIRAKSHDRFMYPGTDNNILRVTFSSPCRGVLNTPHKRPGTGRIRAKSHECFMYPGTDNAKPHESRIHPKMDNANTWRSFSTENGCGAYAIRPYTGTKTVRAGAHISDSFHYPTFAL